MLCGKCDRCISMATGMDVKSRLKFGGFPLTTNCQLKNNEMLLYGGDYLSSFCRISNLEEKDPIGMRSIPLEDREDYKAGVAAEREACAKLVEEQQCDGLSYIDKALVSVAKMIRERSK